MNRRAFLTWLGGTAAGVALAPTLDLDRLLWTPGARTIFIPDPPKVEIATWHTHFAKGDVFTIDGRFAFNTITRQPTDRLQHFVVTSDVVPGQVVDIAAIHPRVDVSRHRPTGNANDFSKFLAQRYPR